LFGESGSCKTFVALIAIVEQILLGFHVVLIDYEGSENSIVERLRELGVTWEQVDEQFSYIRPDGKFTDTEQAIVFEDAIAKRGTPSLVIIDGMTEAFAQSGFNPNEGVDVANYFASAPKWFANLGAAVVLIDHVTKSNDKTNRGSYAIGSERKRSGITGAAYMVDLMVPFGRGKTGRVKLTLAKDRSGYVEAHTDTGRVIAEVVLRSNPDGSITTSVEAPSDFVSGPFRPTGKMEQLSKALEASPNGLVTRVLRSAVTGNVGTKALAIDLLVSEGYFEVKSGSHNSVLHFSAKPYREALEGTNEGGDNAVI
jgi:hypothetical protein